MAEQNHACDPEVVRREYDNYKQSFLRWRAKQEMTIEAWWNSVMSLGKLTNVLEKIEMPDHEMSLRGFIPEAYADKPDPIKYHEQLKATQAFFAKYNSIVDQSWYEANEKLKKANELIQGS